MSKLSKNPIVIRPYRPSDSEEILDVHYRSVHQIGSLYYPAEVVKDWAPEVTLKRIADHIHKMRIGNEVTLVAEMNGTVVGFASIIQDQNKLGAVYVDPHMARTGIGSALIKSIEDLARNKGIKELQLDSSLGAVSFYRAQGYLEKAKSRHTLQSGRQMDCMTMIKCL